MATDRVGEKRGEPAIAPVKDASASEANRRPLKSNKLDRTLAELENAFAEWDSISEDAPKSAAAQNSPPKKPSKLAPDATQAPEEQEFRSKTRKLLSQLREQLADLSKD